MQLIYKKKKKKTWFYATTCSLGQFDEKINHMKISKSWILKTKGCKGNDSFIKSLADYIYIH